MLALKPWLAQLREGDVLLFLTCVKDFWDLRRRWQAGRAKPRFHLGEGGALVLEPVEHGLYSWLRDRSHFASAIGQVVSRRYKASGADVRAAFQIYWALLDERVLARLPRGVEVIVAAHGFEGPKAPAGAVYGEVRDGFAREAQRRPVRLVGLDPALSARPSEEVSAPAVPGDRRAAGALDGQ